MTEILETWMDRYVEAWASNDPDAIAALFSPEAIYDPQTDDGELHGVEEIVNWWIEVGDDPANWDFQWISLIENDELAVITGNTTYFAPPSSFRNLWVIKFDGEGRCRDFTEWYIEEATG